MSGQASAYEYDAFGKTLRESGPYAASNPFRYSTKYADTETGLVYYGHRYYSPSLGRFINKDPSEERGGLNLYGFCGNGPVNRFDVLGLDATGDDFLHYYLNDGTVDSSKWSNADWQGWSNYSWGIAQEQYDGYYNGFDGHSPFAISGPSIAGGRTEGFFTARQDFAGLDNLMASTDTYPRTNRDGSPSRGGGSAQTGAGNFRVYDEATGVWREIAGTGTIDSTDGGVHAGGDGGIGSDGSIPGARGGEANALTPNVKMNGVTLSPSVTAPGGVLTLIQANSHYRNGGGAPVVVYAPLIDFSEVNPKGFDGNGLQYYKLPKSGEIFMSTAH